MQKSEIYTFFHRLRLSQTLTISFLVLTALIILIANYIHGGLLESKMQHEYLVIILFAIVNLTVVLLLNGKIKRALLQCMPDDSIKAKLINFRKAYFKQLFWTTVLVLLNNLAFLLTGLELIFLQTFALLIFLLSLQPTAGKFLKHSALPDQQKQLFY
ncbi:MAG: hypothetical protein R6T91_04515 [Bacteroidales bacterium]